MLLPEIGDSAHTMREYSGGKIAGVKGLIFRKAKKIVNREIIVNVVPTSLNSTVMVLYPAPGKVAPNTTLRPISPHSRSGQAPTTAPAN